MSSAKEQLNVSFGCPDIPLEMSADKYPPPEVTIMLPSSEVLEEHNNESPAQDQVFYAGLNPHPPRVVLSGIDTLYLGYSVLVKETVLSYLSEKKEEAKEKERTFEGIPVSLGSSTFILRPVGVQRYAYVLENSDLSLWVSSKDNVPYPTVYVCLHSTMLLEKGAEAAVEKVRAFLSENLGLIYREKVSRVDMYADFAGVELSLEDMKKFVTKASRRDIHVVRGSEISGFSFGNGSIVARVYDKVRELKKHNKEYMYDFWSGVSEGEPVWRVEFQLRREFLGECSIESFRTFQEKSGSLWKYLTEEWLSQRELDNANTTRRTETSFWEKVKGVGSFFSSITGSITGKISRKGSLTHLIKMIKGCLTSIGAILSKSNLEITLSSVLEWVCLRVKEELASLKEGQGVNREEAYEVYLEERSSKEFALQVMRKAVCYA